MLELVEIVDGVVLFVVHLALTLFVPLALFVGLAGVVAMLVGLPLGLLARPFVGRGEARHPLRALLRLLIITAVPAAVGVAAVLFALATLAGTAPDAGGGIAEGTRQFVGLIASLQDAGIRAWTGLALDDVLDRTARVDGLRPLGAFTALVAAHLYETLSPPTSLLVFRWVFALVVVSVSLAAIGASPLAFFGRLQLRRDAPLPERAAAGQEPLAPPRGDRLAIVSPRAEVGRAVGARLALSGFEDVASFASLQDLSRADGPPPQVVFLDARALRSDPDGVTLPRGLMRRSVLLVDGDEPAPADGTRFAFVLRTEALSDQLADAAWRILALQPDARSA